MNKIFKFAKKKNPFNSLIQNQKYFLHFPEQRFGGITRNPGLTAKRIIKAVGERLREFDPERWSTVPITFKTNFLDEDGYCDIYTAIQIHDALEKEFNIDIKDKCILINDIETAFYVITHSHTAV